jgi:hypothetical protein
MKELPMGSHFTDSVVFSLIDSSVEYSDAWRLFSYALTDAAWTSQTNAQFVVLSCANESAAIAGDIEGIQVSTQPS